MNLLDFQALRVVRRRPLILAFSRKGEKVQVECEDKSAA
jgi:hypothetical protein